MSPGENTEIFDQEQLAELRKKHFKIKKSADKAEKIEKRSRIKFIGFFVLLIAVLLSAITLIWFMLSSG